MIWAIAYNVVPSTSMHLFVENCACMGREARERTRSRPSARGHITPASALTHLPTHYAVTQSTFCWRFRASDDSGHLGIGAKDVVVALGCLLFRKWFLTQP